RGLAASCACPSHHSAIGRLSITMIRKIIALVEAKQGGVAMPRVAGCTQKIASSSAVFAYGCEEYPPL
ncbi:hypothetical protein ACCT09_07820, partial [Rhizobium ruizarguesonis]